MRFWLMGLAALAGLFGAAGVGLAAVGAHRSGNPNVTTAACFLLLHATAIMAICALARPAPARGLLLAASLLALGVLLFSGELALHALTDMAVVPLAAPTGGLMMIAGWLAAAIAIAFTLRDNKRQ